jgi:hypothetical protein
MRILAMWSIHRKMKISPAPAVTGILRKNDIIAATSLDALKSIDQFVVAWHLNREQEGATNGRIQRNVGESPHYWPSIVGQQRPWTAQ